MIVQDDYTQKFRWFIGVVKAVDDPLSANRVKVRIKGIHPEDPNGDGFEEQNNTQIAPPFSSNTAPPSGSSLVGVKGLIQVDRSTLPTNTQLSGKISKNYTLGHLTTGTIVSGRYCVPYMQYLDSDIIYNLSMLATNVLDPLKDHFQNLVITSGWRPIQRGAASGAPGNHPKGYAADVQLSGGSKGATQIYEYIRSELRGRYTKLGYEGTWIHVQLGGSPGTTTNPTYFTGGNAGSVNT